VKPLRALVTATFPDGTEGKTFFITATQIGKQAALTKEQYTYIHDYNFTTFTVNSKGSHKPSSEALSHAMIYEVHPEIQAVIHIHSKPLWDFLKANNTLATTAEYGTATMVEEIAGLYKKLEPFSNKAFVMKGHEDGIITFGRSIEEAELTLYTILQNYLHQTRSEEHTSELQSHSDLVCRLLLEKKNKQPCN